METVMTVPPWRPSSKPRRQNGCGARSLIPDDKPKGPSEMTSTHSKMLKDGTQRSEISAPWDIKNGSLKEHGAVYFIQTSPLYLLFDNEAIISAVLFVLSRISIIKNKNPKVGTATIAENKRPRITAPGPPTHPPNKAPKNRKTTTPNWQKMSNDLITIVFNLFSNSFIMFRLIANYRT